MVVQHQLLQLRRQQLLQLCLLQLLRLEKHTGATAAAQRAGHGGELGLITTLGTQMLEANGPKMGKKGGDILLHLLISKVNSPSCSLMLT